MKIRYAVVTLLFLVSVLITGATMADYMPPWSYIGLDQTIYSGESFDQKTAIGGGTEPLTAVLTAYGNLTVNHPDTFAYHNQIFFDVTYTPGWTGTDSVAFSILDTRGGVSRSVCVLTVLPAPVPVEVSTWGGIKALFE